MGLAGPQLDVSGWHNGAIWACAAYELPRALPQHLPDGLFTTLDLSFSLLPFLSFLFQPSSSPLRMTVHTYASARLRMFEAPCICGRSRHCMSRQPASPGLLYSVTRKVDLADNPQLCPSRSPRRRTSLSGSVCNSKENEKG